MSISLNNKNRTTCHRYFFQHRQTINFIFFFVGLIFISTFCFSHKIDIGLFVEKYLFNRRINSLPAIIAKHLNSSPTNESSNKHQSTIAFSEKTDLRIQVEPFSDGPFDQLYSNDNLFIGFFQSFHPWISLELSKPIPFHLPFNHTRAPPNKIKKTIFLSGKFNFN